MLRVGKLTDYAIVVMAHMARHAHRCVHSASELADETGVPLPTVQKILKQLAAAELLRSMRGARGGYSLSDDPAHTSLLALLEAMEGPIAMVSCAHTEGCADEARCGVSEHWLIINDAVRGALEQVSLLDVSRVRPVKAPSDVHSKEAP